MIRTAELVHFDTARWELALATNIDEVKLIRDKAEILRQYIRQQGASLEMQNQCAEIKIRAERRAGEILAEREPHPPGPQPVTLHHVRYPPSLKDLGISEIQSHRWQLEASVPEEKFEQWVAKVKADKEELTSIGLRTFVKYYQTKVLTSTESNEWYTPKKYIDAVYEVMGGVDLDPASHELANQVVGAVQFYDIESNGLLHNWQGRIFLNPPWGGIAGEFILKLVTEYEAGNVKEAIALVNAHCTDTNWFQQLWDYVLCFTDHRIDFMRSENCQSNGGSTHGSVFIYLGDKRDKFAHVFKKFGAVVSRYDHKRSQ